MYTFLPNQVWLLDNDIDAIQEVNRLFGEKRKDVLRNSIEMNDVKKWFNEANAPPDVILLDICLKEGEGEIVAEAKTNFAELSSLTKVSGIRFLTWLRCEWPKLPVVLMSGYWKQSPEMPNWP